MPVLSSQSRANRASVVPVRIRIGEVFRVSHGAASVGAIGSGFRSYVELTRGQHSKSADIQKGIWAYKPVRSGSGWRIPAILLHTNTFKGGTEFTPWVDVVDPDAGFALFHGDNRDSETTPLETRGNRLLVEARRLGSDPLTRAQTPPILLFTQKDVEGSRKGYREFAGVGVVRHLTLATQKERNRDRYFTNVVAELVLFRMDYENEAFDWTWIDTRRDPSASDEETLSDAPAAWRDWIESGDPALEHCRRRVAGYQVISAEAQLPGDPAESALLQQVSTHFASDPHSFEGLASLIATRVVGSNCIRGWVTQRSGDGGVDFVSRMTVGSGLNAAKLVVLGQAKCTASVGGRDLARLVARLQRGWLGVLVTTGAFTQSCQRELIDDKYPVLLISGARVARELRLLMHEEAITFEQLIARELEWYLSHLSSSRPERILDDSVFNTAVAL